MILNFQKMKSMQPDSDDEAVEIKTKKMLKRIANYRQRRKPVANATNDSNKDATEVILLFIQLILAVISYTCGQGFAKFTFSFSFSRKRVSQEQAKKAHGQKQHQRKQLFKKSPQMLSTKL